MLVLLAPVMAVVAALVLLTSPGPVFYRQVRVGLDLAGARRDRRQVGDRPPPPRTSPGVARRPPTVAASSPTAGRSSSPSSARCTSTRRRPGPASPSPATRGDPPRPVPARSRSDELPSSGMCSAGRCRWWAPARAAEFIRGLSGRGNPRLSRSARLEAGPDRPGPGAQWLRQRDRGLSPQGTALDLLYLQNCCFRNDLRILLRQAAEVS